VCWDRFIDMLQKMRIHIIPKIRELSVEKDVWNAKAT
jgi:hypothetical protein